MAGPPRDAYGGATVDTTGERIVRASLLQELHLILSPAPNPLTPIVQVFEVTGDVDPDALAHAFTVVLRRHEALRMRFPVRLRPRFAVLSPAERSAWPVPRHDLRTHAAMERDARLHDLIAKLGSELDVGEGPLYEAMLVRLDEARWVIGLAVDHVVFDGASLEVFWRELSDAYARRVATGTDAATRSDAAPGGPAFLDCAEAERADLCGPRPSAAVAHWVEVFETEGRLMPGLHLRADYVESVPGPGPYLTVTRMLSPDAWRTGARIARERRISPYALLLGAAFVALRRASDRDTIGFRIPVSVRTRPGVEDVIGLFAPSMPLFQDTRGGASLPEVVDRLRGPLVRMIQHAMPVTALRAHYRTVGPYALDDGSLRDALRIPHAAFLADLDHPPAPEIAGTRGRWVEPPAEAGVTGSPVVIVAIAPAGAGMRIRVGASTGWYRPALHETLADTLVGQLTSVG